MSELFRKLACMNINLAGTKQDKYTADSTHVKSNPASVTTKVWGKSEYYLDLENEDKKQYKENSTLLNGELLPDLNVSISLLLICL